MPGNVVTLAAADEARSRLATHRWATVTARGLLAFVVCRCAFAVLVRPWRVAETAIVVAVLRACGVTTIERTGSQILVVSSDHGPFLADVGSLCSSLGVVLAFMGIAAVSHRSSLRRRTCAVATGAAIVVCCNLARIMATVLVGLRNGPGAIEGFHDGPATAFAVVTVLAGFAVVILGTSPRRFEIAAQGSRLPAEDM